MGTYWLLGAWRQVLSAMLLLLFCKQSFAQDNIVHWFHDGRPPAYIVSENGLEGFAGYSLNWFIKHLPQYIHQVDIKPLSRALKAFETGESLCLPAMIKTPERESHVVFSQLIAFNLPISVVVRVDKIDLFRHLTDRDGHIDFQKLLRETRLHGARKIGRSYSPAIDAMLDDMPDNNSISSSANDTNLLHLLEVDRLDWALFYPAEITHQAKGKGIVSEYLSIPIRNASQPLEIYVGCTKNEAGYQIISAVNMLVQDYPKRPWTNEFIAYLQPSDRKWIMELFNSDVDLVD
ncbi:MAG: hypothetical protein KTR23_01215 [Rhodospirillales bacterium]|nr:hypothetical protein [Rhodospirillales bacterium]